METPPYTNTNTNPPSPTPTPTPSPTKAKPRLNSTPGGAGGVRAKPTLPAAPPEGTPGLTKKRGGVKKVEGLNESAFAEWDCERRRRGGKSKASWTPAAQAKSAKLLAQHTPAEQQAMIDASIAAGWQGLFPPKPNGSGRDDERMKKIREDFVKRHGGKAPIDGEVVRDE